MQKDKKIHLISKALFIYSLVVFQEKALIQCSQHQVMYFLLTRTFALHSLLTERLLSVNLVIEPVAVVCFFSAAREFLSLQQNLAIASVSNFLSIFMTSIRSAV